MNQKYEMFFLENPEKVWGEQSQVETLANAEFIEENEELRQLFEQFQLNADVQATWIDLIDNSGKEPAQVAQDWLRDNPDWTRQWLEGVEATDGTDGTDGFEALQQHLEEQASSAS